MKSHIVLIPAYNSSEEDVIRTINSIPIGNDILIIDDGSDYDIKQLILSLDSISNKSNIIFGRNDINLGIEKTLRVGIDRVKDDYKYVVRLDIGDEIVDDRIGKQISFLEKNEDYSIVGCWTDYTDEHGRVIFQSKLPVTNKEIKKMMYINNMFVHPAVTMRISTVINVGNYRDSYKACEDYDLFFRMLNVSKGYNIPEVLMRYEVSFSSISSKKRKIQVVNRIKIIINNFKFFKFGVIPYYGVLRSTAMLIIGREVTTFLRKILSK